MNEMPEQLTLAKLFEIKDLWEKEAIKPYKGMIGLKRSGFFQINSEREHKLLEKGINNASTHKIRTKEKQSCS